MAASQLAAGTSDAAKTVASNNYDKFSIDDIILLANHFKVISDAKEFRNVSAIGRRAAMLVAPVAALGMCSIVCMLCGYTVEFDLHNSQSLLFIRLLFNRSAHSAGPSCVS